MYYIIKCPVCVCSEVEKLIEDGDTYFKCCNCSYEFPPSESEFDEIVDYEMDLNLTPKLK